MIKVSTYFQLTRDEQRKIKLVVEKQRCQDCKGSGVCSVCKGEGVIPHECDCEYCDRHHGDYCTACDESGECGYCKGTGFRLLGESELIQAGFTKAEARIAVRERGPS